MITTIISFIISVLLEGILPNVLKNVNLFFIICIIVMGNINKKDENFFYLICFIFGVIYDLMYTNAVFLHGFIYLFLAWLSNKILGKKKNFINMFFCYFILIIIYVISLVLFTLPYKSYNISKIIHLLCDGLIINVLYFIFVYLTYIVINCIFKNRLKKRSY